MNEMQRERFEKAREVDLAYGVPGLGRFRVNVFSQRGSISLVFRAIPFDIKGIDELTLPPVIKKLAMAERGLILVTGATGSGKSTTLAAMIDYINTNRKTHIVTIEDPIEFLHRDKKSIINQREVGSDTMGFQVALKSALRQDPDVILVGEMRDHETIETALTAAETGHLVLSTLHTVDAAETINRIISVFPPFQQRQVRIQLAGGAQGGHLPAPGPAGRRQGPRAGRRGHGGDRPRARADRRQGQDQADPRCHPAGLRSLRHADLRPVADGAAQKQADHLRGGPAPGLQPG